MTPHHRAAEVAHDLAALAPVAADPSLPPGGRVEFLLFGFTTPDGAVQVYASRAVTEVEIATDQEWLDVPDYFGRHRQIPGPRGHTVTAKLDEYAVATGDTMRGALAALTDYWENNANEREKQR